MSHMREGSWVITSPRFVGRVTLWRNAGTHVDVFPEIRESCHTYEVVLAHIWMSHVTSMNASGHMDGWVMSHVCMRHVYVWHDSCICVTWLVYMCDITYSYVCHDSFICVTWLVYMCDMTHASCHTWMRQVTDKNESWRTHEWVTSHAGGIGADESCVWHDKFVCMTLLIHKRVMSHIWIGADESWHTWKRVMSHIWMSHVTHMNESCHTYEWVMSHIWISHVTLINESCHTYKRVMSHI